MFSHRRARHNNRNIQYPLSIHNTIIFHIIKMSPVGRTLECHYFCYVTGEMDLMFVYVVEHMQVLHCSPSSTDQMVEIVHIDRCGDMTWLVHVEQFLMRS